MIGMDDPRHARMRRIVSRGFTPRRLAQLTDEVATTATKIVDDVIDRGECDAVTEIAARLPMKIVCDLMGVPASQYDFVFDASNVVLGAGDPEYVPEGTDISWGLQLLTEHPDQRAIWLADIDGVTPTAVDEIVRVASPVIFMRRTCTQDTELGGTPLREGDKLALFYWAANRDPAYFPDPDRFDVLRSPNHHVGFGGPGPHFCLGAHLARREMSVMFRELLTRVPDIHATAPPHRLRSMFINGVKHLPVAFTRGRAHSRRRLGPPGSAGATPSRSTCPTARSTPSPTTGPCWRARRSPRPTRCCRPRTSPPSSPTPAPGRR